MKKKLLSGLLALCMIVCFMPAAAFAENQVSINETNFPDENFRSYVATYLDTDKDGFLSEAEIADVTEIYVSTEHISSLAGIEIFSQLQKLDCCVNQLTTLDVSNNTALKYLECSNNDLTSLNVSGNTALTGLYCWSNDLTNLDVSGNIALINLRCESNKITTLDVSNNTELKVLSCGGNPLSTLDVSKNTKLYELGCGNNGLTTLDVSGNTALETLSCGGNDLTTLDVSSNTELETLSCDGNDLTTLDVSSNTVLNYLYCSNNNLTSLDVSKNKLYLLNCRDNPLSTLDVSKNTNLIELNCGGNDLTTLDVSRNTSLQSLSCDGNNLTTLDVSKNTRLQRLSCDGNNLTTLDVSSNTALHYLYCSNNNLTSLDVSKHALYSLNCGQNEYIVYANPDRTFDLSTLPGSFDVSKASGWTGGTVDGDVLTFDDGINTVTYTYDCGNTNSGVVNPTFTLNLHEHSYGAWQSNGNDTHTRSCLTEGCGFSETENCYGGTATVTERATCEVCGQPYGNLAPQAVISGTNITGKVGNEITVDLNLDENPGLVSMMVEVVYDKEVLEYIDASNGDVFPTNSFLPPDVAEDGGKVLSWQNSTVKENINATGKLASLTFRIKDSASVGETRINFICEKSKNEALNAQGESVAVVSNASKVNVILFYYGDVDNNDKIDAADALYLRRYLAKWNNYTNIPLNAVDLDADGKVTIRDLTILERHIAGWNGYDTLPITSEQLPVDQN